VRGGVNSVTEGDGVRTRRRHALQVDDRPEHLPWSAAQPSATISPPHGPQARQRHSSHQRRAVRLRLRVSLRLAI